MKKETIEILREKHPKGYSKTEYLTDHSTEILDKLVEWSQDNNYRIYIHKIRHIEENDSNEIYKCFRYGAEIPREQYFENLRKEGYYAVYYCELVSYLDIYYQ